MGWRILVVEDDRDQRLGLVEILRRDGHEVLQAASAERALAILQHSEVDLIIADYQLGGATGAWLARQIRRGRAAPQVLLLTGHTALADAAGLPLVRKPVDPDRFLQQVRQSLEGPAPDDGRVAPRQRIAFVLYSNGGLPSRRAERRIKSVLDRYDTSQVSLTVVDVCGTLPHQAEEHRVVVTPTLLKTFPAPRVWVTGELERTGVLQRLLDEAGVEARR